MDNVTLIATLLRNLALISQDPALGYRGSAITSTLIAVAGLVQRGDAMAGELAALAAQVEQMAAEDREPTKSEWAALRARSDAAHAILQEGATE